MTVGFAMTDSADHVLNMRTQKADCKGFKHLLILVSMGVLEQIERQVYTKFKKRLNLFTSFISQNNSYICEENRVSNWEQAKGIFQRC